jgi:hypothetical protein
VSYWLCAAHCPNCVSRFEHQLLLLLLLLLLQLLLRHHSIRAKACIPACSLLQLLLLLPSCRSGLQQLCAVWVRA